MKMEEGERVKKKRKLFCEYGPVCYKISLFKECRKKELRDFFQGRKFAKKKSAESLPYLWKGDAKIMVRQLHGVDMTLQQNKVTNLLIAGKKIDGIIVEPGEEFSFWSLVGNPTKRKGYLEGLVISKSNLGKGVGGGLCQMGNMIHWLVLHTPLEVTELHHHSDAIFPDNKRRSPFGTGTSINYKALDYRFKNVTDAPVQVRIWQDDTFLFGEIRSTVPTKYTYELTEEDHHFAKDEDGVFFRNSKVYRHIIDKATNEEIKKELILDNHSKVLYDYDLIPPDEIRA